MALVKGGLEFRSKNMYHFIFQQVTPLGGAINENKNKFEVEVEI